MSESLERLRSELRPSEQRMAVVGTALRMC